MRTRTSGAGEPDGNGMLLLVAAFNNVSSTSVSITVPTAAAFSSGCLPGLITKSSGTRLGDSVGVGVIETNETAEAVDEVVGDGVMDELGDMVCEGFAELEAVGVVVVEAVAEPVMEGKVEGDGIGCPDGSGGVIEGCVENDGVADKLSDGDIEVVGDAEIEAVELGVSVGIGKIGAM